MFITSFYATYGSYMWQIISSSITSSKLTILELEINFTHNYKNRKWKRQIQMLHHSFNQSRFETSVSQTHNKNSLFNYVVERDTDQFRENRPS